MSKLVVVVYRIVVCRIVVLGKLFQNANYAQTVTCVILNNCNYIILHIKCELKYSTKYDDVYRLS